MPAGLRMYIHVLFSQRSYESVGYVVFFSHKASFRTLQTYFNVADSNNIP